MNDIYKECLEYLQNPNLDMKAILCTPQYVVRINQ